MWRERVAGPRQPLTLQNLPPQVVIRTLDALVQQTFRFVPSQSPCTIVPVVESSLR